jgi:hypothetical protein
VREMVLPQIERHGAIVAWIIDDTGFPAYFDDCGQGFRSKPDSGSSDCGQQSDEAGQLFPSTR